MDLAARIETLVPGAKYQGSCTGGDEATYEALRWNDAEKKPTWAEIQAAMEYKDANRERVKEIQAKCTAGTATPAEVQEALSLILPKG